MKNLSPNTEYTIGILATMTLYVALLFLSLHLIQTAHPTGALLYVIAALPAFPVGGSLLVFLRYVDRVDEYVRAVLVRRIIVAIGLTLFAATFWGFIEENAHAYHFPLWMVYPTFWASFAVACILYRKA